LGTLKWDFENDFEKLGMECYSIDGFQRNEFENKVGMYIPSWRQEFFRNDIVITKCSLRTINPCNHDYPGMGRGLARSLFTLVRKSHNYKRVRSTPESGLSQVVGNSIAGPPIGYPPGRHYGSPDVALGLRSNVEVDCQDEVHTP
jgi:hypothetical protein